MGLIGRRGGPRSEADVKGRIADLEAAVVQAVSERRQAKIERDKAAAEREIAACKRIELQRQMKDRRDNEAQFKREVRWFLSPR